MSEKTQSQEKLGETPLMRAKITMTQRLMPRLIRAVAVAETTIIHFGKLILRRRSPREMIALIPWPVHSVKKFQRTVPVKR